MEPSELTRHYLALADDAEKSGDTKMQEICFRKLANLPLEPNLKFHVADFLAKRKRVDQARILIRQLAPSDRKGYPLAHKWLAVDLLRAPLAEKPDPNLVAEVLFHANIAADNLLGDTDAASLYGALLMRVGRLEEALNYFDRASQTMPEFFLTVSELEAKLGRDVQARLSRSRAKDHFRSKLRDNPKDISARINLVRALLPDGEVKDAVKSLREGLVLADDPRLRIALADCSIWKFDALKIEEREASPGFNLLNYAITTAPTHGPTLERIAIVTANKTEGNWQAMRERLEACLVAGTAPATCHLFLANGYLQKKELAKARAHLELAYRIDPGMVIVLNNLAYLIAFEQPTDLARAEELIEQAIQIVAPNNVRETLEIRETRGQIKLKLKKYTEAISDLEAVLASYSNSKKVRSALADAYEGFGHPELAAKYRR